jgi:shikimate kinase
MAVALVGLPAVGKTTVGRLVAEQLGVGCIDTDAAIEESSGQSISEIFAAHGEQYFRDLEFAVTAAALEQGAVVSLGGGAVTNPRVRELLRDHFVVWLRVSASTALRRAGETTHRPLLAGDAKAKLTALKEERDPLYAAVSDLSLSANRASAAALAKRIADAVVARQASGQAAFQPGGELNE